MSQASMTNDDLNNNKDHDEGCPRAFSALALVHHVVSRAIEQALIEHVSLSLNEFEVLVDLDSRPGNWAPATTLTTAARLSQPAISRLIDRLESKKLVLRTACPEDKRSVTVRLTEQGKAILKRAIPVHNECVREKLLASLTLEEREHLRVSLLKVAAANAHCKE